MHWLYFSFGGFHDEILFVSIRKLYFVALLPGNHLFLMSGVIGLCKGCLIWVCVMIGFRGRLVAFGILHLLFGWLLGQSGNYVSLYLILIYAHFELAKLLSSTEVEGEPMLHLKELNFYFMESKNNYSSCFDLMEISLHVIVHVEDGSYRWRSFKIPVLLAFSDPSEINKDFL